MQPNALHIDCDACFALFCQHIREAGMRGHGTSLYCPHGKLLFAARMREDGEGFDLTVSGPMSKEEADTVIATANAVIEQRHAGIVPN